VKLARKHRDMLAGLIEDVLADFVIRYPHKAGRFDPDLWRWEPSRAAIESLLDDFLDCVASDLLPSPSALADVLDDCEPPPGAVMPRWLVEENQGDLEVRRRRDDSVR